jgi:hypothetical protein
MPVEPVWLLIVAGPGGTKTELLRALYDLSDVHPLSDLTPQTFLSGDKINKNSSLLDRLSSEVILVMKDFTTVLEMNADKRAAILSQLREIYDGDFGKEFGNGESKSWQGKVTMIAGVTSIIDRHQTVFQVLGERFIKYCPMRSDPMQITKQAIKNSGNEQQMRDEIRAAFTNYIEGVEISDEPPQVPEDYQTAIMHLAVFVAKARSGVIRDGYSREIAFVPEPEHPTRLVKQLVNLMSALARISGDFTLDDYQHILKIGMDSLPSVRRDIIEYLMTTTMSSIAEIADEIGYPANTVRRQLEEMQCLGVLKADSSSMAYSYGLSDETFDLLAKVQPELTLPEKSEGVNKEVTDQEVI